jgi:hypothetical protein
MRPQAHVQAQAEDRVLQRHTTLSYEEPGNSLRQAVYRAVYARQNARVQLQLGGLGEVTYLSPEEARCAAATVDGGLDRVWELWTGPGPEE